MTFDRIPPLFGSWLAVTGKLQREAYGIDLEQLEGDAYGDHVQMNVTAIIAELGELLVEIPGWKTWVTERRRPDPEGRDRAVGELVDVLHFVANLLVGLRVTDLELRLKYQEKVDRNRERMASNAYDGVSSKCTNCKRALDDVGTTVMLKDPSGPVRICLACHAEQDIARGSKCPRCGRALDAVNAINVGRIKGEVQMGLCNACGLELPIEIVREFAAQEDVDPVTQASDPGPH